MVFIDSLSEKNVRTTISLTAARGRVIILIFKILFII